MLAVAHFSEQWKWSMELAANRAPRHPRDLALRQTARMSCKADCTTDGWSVYLTSLFSGLALSQCLIIIPTGERECVCVFCLFWRVGLWHAAGKYKHVCLVFGIMSTWKLDGHSVHAWPRCWRCTAWNCWNLIWRETVRLCWHAFACYMQIGSHWISLAACWEGPRTMSICLPLLFQGTSLLRNTVSPWAQQCCRYAFF